MNFALGNNPNPSEISDAINYLLGNLGSNNAQYDPVTGIITQNNVVIGYLFRYLWVKYATSFNGSTGFSDSPTNATYYGLSNSNSPAEVLTPSSYVWYPFNFGTTNFFFYLTTGGRTITMFQGTTIPGTGWAVDPTTAIDLDQVAAVSGTNGLQGNQGVPAYFTYGEELDVANEIVSFLGQNPNPILNTVTSGAYLNTGITVNSTNALTAVTCTTTNTYLTGTAGASLAITITAASPAINGLKITVMSTAARPLTTWISTGGIFVGTPAALVANTPVCLQYNHSNTTWYISQ